MTGEKIMQKAIAGTLPEWCGRESERNSGSGWATGLPEQQISANQFRRGNK